MALRPIDECVGDGVHKQNACRVPTLTTPVLAELKTLLPNVASFENEAAHFVAEAPMGGLEVNFQP